MTNEIEHVLDMPTLDEPCEACIDDTAVPDRDKPLWLQVGALVRQTGKLAEQQFLKDIAWLGEDARKNPNDTIDGCLMRLNSLGLDFYDAEIWNENYDRDHDGLAIEWNFQPGDTVGWAHDLLVRHRHEIIRWHLLWANAYDGEELDWKDCSFIRELENPLVRIKLRPPSAAWNDGLQQLTRKRRRLIVEKAMTSMLRRFATASDRVLDTGYLVLSANGLAFAEQETPREPGLSITLPAGSSTHSMIEAFEGQARSAVSSLLDWVVDMDPKRVPQRDAYRLQTALERTAREVEMFINPRDEVPF